MSNGTTTADQTTLLCDASQEQIARFEAAARAAGHASGKSAANHWNLWDSTVAEAIAAVSSEEECSGLLRCGCGAWMGEPCQWTGEVGDMVVVEWMPEHLRASHEAAGNSGMYTDNGAVRVAVERSCAELLIAEDADWSRIVTSDATIVQAHADPA